MDPRGSGVVSLMLEVTCLTPLSARSSCGARCHRRAGEHVGDGVRDFVFGGREVGLDEAAALDRADRCRREILGLCFDFGLT